MQKVNSKDGTQIAYDNQGQGPAVILVDGALGYRGFGSSTDLAGLLSTDFTVYYYDRRGKGESTDAKPYSIEREVEDIDALINTAGGEAFIYGISSGACLALEAAIKLGKKVKKLALYEAPYDSAESAAKPWKSYRKELAELVADNRFGDAVVLFMNFVGTPKEMIDGMRQSPIWQKMEALAPTLIYDAAAIGVDRSVPLDRAAKVTAQTLVMDGSESLNINPFMRTTAESLTKVIPNAQHRILEGQRHDVDNKVLAPVLIEFFCG